MDDQKWHLMTEIDSVALWKPDLEPCPRRRVMNGDCLQELFDRHSSYLYALGSPEAPKI